MAQQNLTETSVPAGSVALVIESVSVYEALPTPLAWYGRTDSPPPGKVTRRLLAAAAPLAPRAPWGR